MTTNRIIIILGKAYQFHGQSHMFHRISPTLSRFYTKKGIFLYAWEARTPDEVGAWQEIGYYNNKEEN